MKRIHIGTHSHEEEEKLRLFFRALRWINLNDFACLGEQATPFGRINFQDGIQTWVNPKVCGKSFLDKPGKLL